MKSKKTGDLLLLANGLMAIVLLNMIASLYFFRVDLTEEKRYSIKEPTRQLLRNLDDKIYIDVYLEGELNAGFRRFQKAIRETLEEFRVYSDNKVQYELIDPSLAMGEKAQNEFMTDLANKGIQPTRVVDTKDGQRVEKIIFPGVVVSDGSSEVGVMLLKGNKARTSEEEINQSIEGVEYELANAIYKLVNTERRRVGFVTGHGELDSINIVGFNNALLELYDVYKVNLTRKDVLQYDALIIAKPRHAFSEVEKFKLDQYIMRGGKVMYLLDKLEANMDSASSDMYMALPYQTNLDDMLFKHGVRINYDLIQDRSSALYPVVVSEVGGKPRIQRMEWPFFPLINHYSEHTITRNLDAVITRFVSSMDTVRAINVRKTPLLMSSQYSRKAGAPVNVSINMLRKNINPTDFSLSHIPVGYLLEGSFTSLYKNRFLPEGTSSANFKEESVPTKLIVLSDGDIARNEVNVRSGQPLPLGFDPVSNYTFANQDLLMNAMAYLMEEGGLINARNKAIKIRPLDRQRTQAEKTKWQLINLLIPLLLLVAYGVIRAFLRKKKYARF